jgi:hypothetical protein
MPDDPRPTEDDLVQSNADLRRLIDDAQRLQQQIATHLRKLRAGAAANDSDAARSDRRRRPRKT